MAKAKSCNWMSTFWPNGMLSDEKAKERQTFVFG
jgi:hypothetical protein